ncbi:hypothetical protein T492DRAFT_1020288 [Pavlovales sp. CCMP2436]|nr:hypothetical protein T492DRAFT_1020288 [Pavlovales sp. CCMP2436]
MLRDQATGAPATGRDRKRHNSRHDKSLAYIKKALDVIKSNLPVEDAHDKLLWRLPEGDVDWNEIAVRCHTRLDFPWRAVGEFDSEIREKVQLYQDFKRKLCLRVRDCWLTVSDAERRVDAVDTLLESAPPYLRDSLSGIRSPSDAHAAFEAASAGEEDMKELLARGLSADRVWRCEAQKPAPSRLGNSSSSSMRTLAVKAMQACLPSIREGLGVKFPGLSTVPPLSQSSTWTGVPKVPFARETIPYAEHDDEEGNSGDEEAFAHDDLLADQDDEEGNSGDEEPPPALPSPSLAPPSAPAHPAAAVPRRHPPPPSPPLAAVDLPASGGSSSPTLATTLATGAGASRRPRTARGGVGGASSKTTGLSARSPRRAVDVIAPTPLARLQALSGRAEAMRAARAAAISSPQPTVRLDCSLLLKLAPDGSIVALTGDEAALVGEALSCAAVRDGNLVNFVVARPKGLPGKTQTGAGITITPFELGRLNMKEFLNSEVVDAGLASVVRQVGAVGVEVYAFSGYLVAELYTRNFIDRVTHWTHAVPRLLSSRYLLFPVNTHLHWFLILADPARRRFEMFDSLPTFISRPLAIEYVEAVAMYLHEELGRRRRRMDEHRIEGEHALDSVLDWNTVWWVEAVEAAEASEHGPSGYELPRQVDKSNDCGMCLIFSALARLRGFLPSYCSEELRQRGRHVVASWALVGE